MAEAGLSKIRAKVKGSGRMEMDREQAEQIIFLLTAILDEIRNSNAWKLREASKR